MKTAFTFLYLLCSLNLFSQQQTQPSMSPEDIEALRNKAKNQRAAAIVMVTVGTGMIIGGIASGINSNSNAAGYIALTGIVLNFASLPFSIISSINRRKIKNASMSFTPSLVPQLYNNGQMQRMVQPVIRLFIPLGR